MEKKRRARINQSLNDLKDILLDSGSVKKEVTKNLTSHRFNFQQKVDSILLFDDCLGFSTEQT